MSATNQQSIEQKLKEFTEVHGTILLGMHRELQTCLKTVESKLESSSQEHRDHSEQLLEAVHIHVADIEKREAAINQLLETYQDSLNHHENVFKDFIAARQTEISADRASIGDMVETARADINSSVAESSRQIENSLREINASFSSSFDEYQERLKRTENEIKGYMQQQQESLNAQSRKLEQQGMDIESLHQITQNMLSDLERKTSEHEAREAAFNKRVRTLTTWGGALFIILLSIGVWRLCIR